jgi:hypothetical protein
MSRMIFIQSCALFPSMFFSFEFIFRSTYDDTSFGCRLSGLPMPTHILVNGTLLLLNAVCILLTPLWPLRECSISPYFLTPCAHGNKLTERYSTHPSFSQLQSHSPTHHVPLSNVLSLFSAPTPSSIVPTLSPLPDQKHS